MRAEKQRLIDYLRIYVDGSEEKIVEAMPSGTAKANTVIQSRRTVYGDATVSKEAHNKLKGEE